MKKNILLVLLLFVGLFTITGCGCSKEETSKNEDKKETDQSFVTVNGIELHINQEKEYKGIKYTITDDLKESDFGQVIQYYLYQDSGPNLLFFRIFYYEGKNHEYIRNDLAIDSNLVEEKGKTNNIEYSFIDTKRTDGTIHYYIIDNNNNSYVINFVSQYDIKDFEKVVLNSIKF